MERILLFVLCLSGWSISCQARWYQHVTLSMTWDEARTYCRKEFTNLATINSLEDMKLLNKTVLSSGLNSAVWIGVYSNINWKWSDGYTGTGAEYRDWDTAEQEPDFWSGDQFCVNVKKDAKWWDYSCWSKFKFICYRGTQQNPEFVYVNQSLDWSSAQRYCRENYTDLATVRNATENQLINSLQPYDEYTWIGLHRDPSIYWADGSPFSYSNWAAGSYPLGSLKSVCGVVDLQNSGKWKLVSCHGKYPFVCYRTAAARQIIKLKVKPEDTSMDLNNPAVKAGILKKLQDRLKGSGVTLKWREQPDGTVFHKERKSSQKKDCKKTEL